MEFKIILTLSDFKNLINLSSNQAISSLIVEILTTFKPIKFEKEFSMVFKRSFITN